MNGPAERSQGTESAPLLTSASALEAWVRSSGFEIAQWHALPSDAGFRRYYRFCDAGGTSYVAAHAPPATEAEASEAFDALARMMAAHGLTAPHIHAYDRQHGFWVLSDLGTQRYDRVIRHNPEQAGPLYTAAFEALRLFQALPQRVIYAWKPYTVALLQHEIDLWVTWFLRAYAEQRHGLQIDWEDWGSWAAWSNAWVPTLVSSHPVLVHRDFQSRNLMHVPSQSSAQSVGILDFQDACWGPPSYDVVSLVWDCYLDWSDAQRLAWAEEAYQVLQIADSGISWPVFWAQIQAMGLQRHLKNAGIFARLCIRDNKPDYLRHIPRVWDYIRYFATHTPGAEWLLRAMEPLAHQGVCALAVEDANRCM